MSESASQLDRRVDVFRVNESAPSMADVPLSRVLPSNGTDARKLMRALATKGTCRIGRFVYRVREG